MHKVNDQNLRGRELRKIISIVYCPPGYPMEKLLNQHNLNYKLCGLHSEIDESYESLTEESYVYAIAEIGKQLH